MARRRRAARVDRSGSGEPAVGRACARGELEAVAGDVCGRAAVAVIAVFRRLSHASRMRRRANSSGARAGVGRFGGVDWVAEEALVRGAARWCVLWATGAVWRRDVEIEGNAAFFVWWPAFSSKIGDGGLLERSWGASGACRTA